MLTDLLLLAPALIVFVILILWPRASAEEEHQQPEAGPPANAIVVDGSNVMHWGGDPSATVLSMVLRALENKGYAPIVFFDASVGYRLGDRYFDEFKLARLTSISSDHICVVEKGTVADEAILAFSRDHNLRVVTNDQFRDWRVQFPHAAQKGRLIKGTFSEGTVKWRGAL